MQPNKFNPREESFKEDKHETRIHHVKTRGIYAGRLTTPQRKRTDDKLGNKSTLMKLRFQKRGIKDQGIPSALDSLQLPQMVGSSNLKLQGDHYLQYFRPLKEVCC